MKNETYANSRNGTIYTDNIILNKKQAWVKKNVNKNTTFM